MARNKVVTGAVVSIAVIAASIWVSGLARYSWSARLGTFGCAAVVLGLGNLWRIKGAGRNIFQTVTETSDRSERLDKPSEPISTWKRATIFWLVVVILAAAWDVLGLLTPQDQHHLTLSALELAYRPLHALLFALWLYGGWLLASLPVARRPRVGEGASKGDQP